MLSVDHREIISPKRRDGKGGMKKGRRHNNAVSLSLLPTYSHTNQSIKAEKWRSVVREVTGSLPFSPWTNKDI